MQFELTKHAEYVIERWRISLRAIRRVLQNPLAIEQDRVDLDLEHRLGRASEYGNRVLRVVIDAKVEPIRVVAVFWDRRARKAL